MAIGRRSLGMILLAASGTSAVSIAVLDAAGGEANSSWLITEMASQCRCVFQPTDCSCDGALRFMDCMAAACESSACSCDGGHFKGACQQMSGRCPSAGLTCYEEHATCLKERAWENGPVHDQVDADDEVSAAGGPLTRLRQSRRGSKAQELGVANDEPKGFHNRIKHHLQAHSKHIKPKSIVEWAYVAVFQLGIIVVLAAAYDAVRMKPALFRLPREIPEKQRVEGEFQYSLLGCLRTPSLFFFSLCCPCLRWADTMDKNKGHATANMVQVKKFPKFWVGIAIFGGLVVFDPMTAGVTLVILVALATYYRQNMRRMYQLRTDNASVIEDFCAYFWCLTCAIVQEARQAELAPPEVEEHSVSLSSS